MARKLLGFVALIAVLAAGAFTVRALAAQGHGGMMGMMSRMKECPMMGAMTQGPRAALRHGAELGLDADQIRRLETLRTSAPAHGAMTRRMQELHAKMNAAAEGPTFDEAAARAALEQMNALHARMGLEMLRTRHAVRQILTPAQRETLAELGAGGMMAGMHGMMKDCPMMKGGMMGGHHGMKQER